MHTNLYETLLDVSKSAMIDDGDLQSSGLLIITAALHGLHIQRAGIWMFNEDQQAIYCRMLIDGDNCVLNGDLRLMRSDYPTYFAHLDNDRTIVANDAVNNPITHEFRDGYLTPLGISSLLDAPVHHRGRLAGIICCEHQGDAREWTNEEIAFVSALADTYGRAINAHQRNLYERQLRELNQELEDKVSALTQSLEEALSKAS
jgi:GAF domain-containing protein